MVHAPTVGAVEGTYDVRIEWKEGNSFNSIRTAQFHVKENAEALAALLQYRATLDATTPAGEGAQLSEENNNLVVELAELRETVTDLKCSFHGRLSTAQTDLTQLQALVRGYQKAKRDIDDWFARAQTDENTPTISEFEALQKTFYDAGQALFASLDLAPVPREEGKE